MPELRIFLPLDTLLEKGSVSRSISRAIPASPGANAAAAKTGGSTSPAKLANSNPAGGVSASNNGMMGSTGGASASPKPSEPAAAEVVACPYGGGSACKTAGGSGAENHRSTGKSMQAHQAYAAKHGGMKASIARAKEDAPREALADAIGVNPSAPPTRTPPKVTKIADPSIGTVGQTSEKPEETAPLDTASAAVGDAVATKPSKDSADPYAKTQPSLFLPVDNHESRKAAHAKLRQEHVKADAASSEKMDAIRKRQQERTEMLDTVRSERRKAKKTLASLKSQKFEGEVPAEHKEAIAAAEKEIAGHDEAISDATKQNRADEKDALKERHAINSRARERKLSRAAVGKPEPKDAYSKLSTKATQKQPESAMELMAVVSHKNRASKLESNIRSHMNNPDITPERKQQLSELADKIASAKEQNHVPSTAERKMLADVASIAGEHKKAYVPPQAPVQKVSSRVQQVAPANADEQRSVDAFKKETSDLAAAVRSHSNNPDISDARKQELSDLADRLDEHAKGTHVPNASDKKSLSDIKKLAGPHRAEFVPKQPDAAPSPPSNAAEHAAFTAHRTKLKSQMGNLESHLARKDLDDSQKATIKVVHERLKELHDSPNKLSAKERAEARDLVVGLGDYGKKHNEQKEKPAKKATAGSGKSVFSGSSGTFARQAAAGRADASPEQASQSMSTNLQYGASAVHDVGHSLLGGGNKSAEEQKPTADAAPTSAAAPATPPPGSPPSGNAAQTPTPSASTTSTTTQATGAPTAGQPASAPSSLATAATVVGGRPGAARSQGQASAAPSQQEPSVSSAKASFKNPKFAPVNIDADLAAQIPGYGDKSEVSAPATKAARVKKSLEPVILFLRVNS